MAITKPTTSTFSTAGTKYDTVSAANYYMEPIATTLVGAGGSSAITFSNIPQNYIHLQLRMLTKGNTTTSNSDDYFYAQFNSDTNYLNYRFHILYGTGAAAGSSQNQSVDTKGSNMGDSIFSGSSQTNVFSASVADILDYTNQGKYKTSRILSGYDYNGGGFISLISSFWMNTSPITSIKIIPGTAITTFNQYSRFSLYGLRG